jgi:hypothetical protein
MGQQQVMAAVAVALGRLAITQCKVQRLILQVRVVQVPRPKLPDYKRTLLVEAGVVHGQLTLRHRAVWAAGVPVAAAGRLVLMQPQGLQTPAVGVGALVKALTPQLLQAAQAVQA